ncbi:MAG: biopolymer transporter ExbD [Planctomycetaceae bacterium]
MLKNATGKLIARKKRTAETDLDITPMIDVTFLLLIFFMVTSTMQTTRDKDIPPAISGENANAGGFLDLSILSPSAVSDESQLLLRQTEVSLDQLAADLEQQALGLPPGEKLDIMIYCERDVRNGFVAEVEEVINGIDGEVDYKFAVRDQ